MLFQELVSKEKPIIILLHGGGLSSWSNQSIASRLEKDYCVITPVIDGHGADGEETFISISDSAKKLIDYIDQHCNGKIFLLGGLSLGAQIVIEILSQREDITKFAVIESGLIYPMKRTTAIMMPFNKLCYGLIHKKWFSKLQAKTLCISSEMFEQYYQDSIKMTKQSLINITRSNGNYELKNTISKVKSKVLIIVGEKEIAIMRKSAQKLSNAIPGSELYIAPKMKHGEISLVHPDKYVMLVKSLIER